MFLFTLLLLTQETPYSWEELHKNANRDPEYFKTLVEDYKVNFPCEACRKNFKKEVSRLEKFLPIDNVKTPEEASIWAWLIHNSVNIRLEKPWYTYSDLLFSIKY